MKHFYIFFSWWQLILFDGLMVVIAWFLAHWFLAHWFGLPLPFVPVLAPLPLVVLIQVGALIVSRVYRVPWLFTSTRDIFVITTSVFFGVSVIGLMLYLFRVPLYSAGSALLLHAVLLIGLLMTSRLLYRAYQTRKK